MKRAKPIGFFCWLTISLLLGNGLVAQQYNYRHYTTKDGLPSMMVYDMLQDPKGFIWIATKDGLCRYDGYRFEYFNTDNGLPDNDVTGIVAAADGKIWALPFNGQLAYIQNNKVYLARKVKEKELPIKRFEIDHKGHLWLARHNGQITEYDDSIIRTLDARKLMGNGYASFQGYADSSGNVWLTVENRVLRYDSTGNSYKQWMIADSLYDRSSKRVLEIAPSQNIYVHNNFTILKIVGDSVKTIFTSAMAAQGADFTILNLFIGANNQLLVATSEGAFKVIENTDGSIQIEQYLKGISVGKAIEDSEGNLWLSTLNDGIYMLTAASRNVTNISPSNGLFESLPGAAFMFGDTLAVSSNYGEVFMLKKIKGQWLCTKLSSNGQTASMGPCIDVPGHGRWCATNSGVCIFKGGQPLSYNHWKFLEASYGNKQWIRTTPADNLLNFSSVKAMALGPDGHFWAGSANGLFEVKMDAAPGAYYVRMIAPQRVSALAWDNQKTLWVSTAGALHYLHNDSLVAIPGYPLPAMASFLHFGTDSIMWVCTARGLYGYRGLADSAPLHYTTKNGLPSNIVNHILHTPQGLIVSTDKGICLLKPSTANGYNPVPLPINDGLISKEVKHTLHLQDRLLVLTSKGVAIIDTSQLKPDPTSPRLYLTKVNIAGKDTAVLPSYTLAHELNNIKLEYVGLLYKSNGDILYRYQMEGIDTGWTETQFTNVQYPTLPPGKYTFNVNARSLQGTWGPEPATVQITILPPFWQTWWFRLLLGIAIVGTAGGISYAIIGYYRNQSQIAQRMVQLEGQALRANMNPHFVFNALNAIHDFIADQDQRSAHLYLGKFAQLIRRILDQSRRNTISLEEELDTLQLYLELENMRFENKFSFNFNVATDIQPFDIELPPMLIQPYIENAIRHGLMNLKVPGQITVAFDMKGNNLQCTITDNGIGRAKAALLGSNRLRNHRSAGMEITQKRVALLNQEATGEDEKGVIIIDLHNAAKESIGTQVILTLPVYKHNQ